MKITRSTNAKVLFLFLCYYVGLRPSGVIEVTTVKVINNVDVRNVI